MPEGNASVTFDARPWPMIIALIVGVALVLVFLFLIFSTTNVANDPHGVDGQSMQTCVENSKPLLGHNSLQFNELTGLSYFCFDLNGHQLMIDEEIIKRDNYVFQRKENVVLLYMVVLITFFGVFLAGMQLWASYRLATAGHGELAGGAEITYSAQGASFKSSVVGLGILAMSFAFFLVFVLYVYTFRDNTHSAQSSSQAAPSVASVSAPSSNSQSAPSAGGPATPNSGNSQLSTPQH